MSEADVDYGSVTKMEASIESGMLCVTWFRGHEILKRAELPLEVDAFGDGPSIEFSFGIPGQDTERHFSFTRCRGREN